MRVRRSVGKLGVPRLATAGAKYKRDQQRHAKAPNPIKRRPTHNLDTEAATTTLHETGQLPAPCALTLSLQAQGIV